MLASSIGHVFLAFLPETLTAGALELELAGRGAAWTRAGVRKLHAKVQQQGYAVTHGGVIPGIASVAAPIFAVNDPMPLAMSIVLPDSAGSPDHLADLARILLAAAADASRELGYQP